MRAAYLCALLGVLILNTNIAQAEMTTTVTQESQTEVTKPAQK